MGASLTLMLGPGADKRGAMVGVGAGSGAEASRGEQVWDSAYVLRADGETDTTSGGRLRR